jgi:hypothetical protein
MKKSVIEISFSVKYIMKKYPSQKDVLLKKLKKIGDLSIENCSHPNDKINENARAINVLARECFELIKKNTN